VGAEATPWPIVGRDGELGAVQAAIADPGCGGVILAGAQGVGRTSLAREIEFRALAAGRGTVWATGTRAASALPFGALAHLLPDGPGGLGLDPTELLGRVEAVVGPSGPAGPPIVVVDDAHLLDGLSAVFLHHAVLRGLVAVALTVRSDAPAPDPVVALWKDGLVDRIPVGPLGREDTAELLVRALGAQLDPRSFERLWALTRGTPLYLREVVRAARAEGSLVRRRGVWQWDGRLAARGRLADLVGSRLADEDPRCRPVLELVACGEPLAVWLVEQLAGPEGLEVAERAGLLEAVPGTDEPAVRFAPCTVTCCGRPCRCAGGGSCASGWRRRCWTGATATGPPDWCGWRCGSWRRARRSEGAACPSPPPPTRPCGTATRAWPSGWPGPRSTPSRPARW